MNKLQLLILTCVNLALAPLANALTNHAFIWDSTNGMRDLGSLGGDSSAFGINDSGEVVGYSYLADQTTMHAFIWTEATGMIDIGTPGGDSHRASSCAEAVNSAGNVVGYGHDVHGLQVAFFWSPAGGFISLGEKFGNSDNGNAAYAINDNDEVTGNLRQHHNLLHAFYWTPEMDKPRDLGVLPPDGRDSVGQGINSLGHIAGQADTGDFEFQAMQWTRSGGMRGIGSIPDSNDTFGMAINDQDAIVGYGFVPGATLAFFKARNSAFRILQSLGGGTFSTASAINEARAIAGTCRTSADSGTHAVLWATPQSAPQDLGTLGGAVGSSGAFGINNVGQVCGYSITP